MHRRISRTAVAAVVALLSAAAPAQAQSDAVKTYPNRAVRFVNPSSPGGGADIIGRIVAQQFSKSFGQNVINDNRPGGSNIIATEIVQKSPPDGYTLLVSVTGTFVTNPLVFAKLPYGDRDFETISIIADAPFILIAHPSVPAKSVRELVALARARPGEMSYASFGNGSSSHLAGELFQAMTKTKLLHVPYKGSAPGMVDLLAGNISVKFDSGFAVVPYINTSRIRTLGVAALKRLPKIPEVPTLDEQGLKEFESGSWYALMAPAGTPREIVMKLHAETVKAIKVPEINQRIIELAAYPIGNTPEEFSAQIVRERNRWAKVVKDAGIKPE
jgi:tripartite-type tricarboxylate transporter receptor subunit TctC